MQNVVCNEIRVFENYEILKCENGEAVMTTEVVDNSLNLYGHAHGGYLYTLCDALAGVCARSLGCELVTLQASMNYIRGAEKGDVLTVTAKCVHNGRSTKVINVETRNQNDKLVNEGVFTVFVTGQVKEG